MAGFRFVAAAILISAMLVFARSETAQGQPPSNQPGPTQNDFRRTFPRVELIYYTGWEGDMWKEIRYFDLDEWAPGKDVIITAEWAPRPSGVSPGARAPGERRSAPIFAQRAQRPAYRTWKVEYVDGLEEGESHLFIGGAGLQRKGMIIYADDDFLGLLHIPTSGWHELGFAARRYRYGGLQQSPLSPSDQQGLR